MSAAKHAAGPVMPGQWLGLLGGGQLGRMFCQAAQSLGYRVAVLDPAENCPAGDVADHHLCATYDDEAALDELGRHCVAVTTEFENVPAASLRRLAGLCAVAPDASAVATVQDRNTEKAFVAGLGIAVAPNVPVLDVQALRDAPDDLFPGILKAARLGYDGKGQARVASRDQALAAFDGFGRVACVLEALVPLDRELSVVIARAADGSAEVFPVARNSHRDGILAVSEIDADVQSDPLADAARDAARRIAQALDYHGVLCVEFFATADNRLYVNEMAPRPHNSGHYSMDACVTSQFEQQVRAMTRMPLGDTRLMNPAIMLNLLGDLWFEGESDTVREPDWAAVLAVPGAKLHLYGKREPRRARKMGHVTVVAQTLAQARAEANRVAAVLRLPAVE